MQTISRTRSDIADQVETLGGQVNALRLKLADSRAPFAAGLLRGAEEALLITINILRDDGVADSEL